MGQIIIFSKTQCPHCVDAKKILTDLSISFTEINIEEDLKNSMLMSYASKRHTVPQIFFNNKYIGGASELKKISTDTLVAQAEAALAEENGPIFLNETQTEEQLRNAIVPIKDVLDPYLPENFVHMPEYKSVEIWYSQIFGFLANCYDQMTLKAEPMSLFIPVLSSLLEETAKEVGTDFGIACMSTAFAANCAYCAAHGADLTMKFAGLSDAEIQEIFKYLNGEIELKMLPFSDKLKVIILLASRMSTQSVSQDDMDFAREIYGIERLRSLCESIAGIGGIMGFLNRWNDLIGVEIEASIKHTIENSALASDWDWGTHDTQEQQNRHMFITQEEVEQKAQMGPPPLKTFQQLNHKVRNDVFAETDAVMTKYTQYDAVLLPAWVGMMTSKDIVRSTTAFYHACLNEGELSSELKHLASYAMLLGAGYPELAAEEKRIAGQVSTSDNFEARLAAFEKAAKKEEAEFDGDILDNKDIVAIKLARQAQVFPHVVRGDLVVELAKHFNPAQIVELVMALAVNGIGQRCIGMLNPMKLYLTTAQKTA